jgi:hypothetical protein
MGFSFHPEAETGFNAAIEEVDCFFKTFELALLGGRKISDKANVADAKCRPAD